jgi:hypothetical protein
MAPFGNCCKKLLGSWVANCRWSRASKLQYGLSENKAFESVDFPDCLGPVMAKMGYCFALLSRSSAAFLWIISNITNLGSINTQDIVGDHCKLSIRFTIYKAYKLAIEGTSQNKQGFIFSN